MSFADSLKRLEDAAYNQQRGVPKGVCEVLQRDLQELLHHFGRLDREVSETKVSKDEGGDHE